MVEIVQNHCCDLFLSTNKWLGGETVKYNNVLWKPRKILWQDLIQAQRIGKNGDKFTSINDKLWKIFSFNPELH